MRSGTLRHRIRLQRATTAADAYGQEVETWADIATVFARVEPVSATEPRVAGASEQRIKYRVKIRAYSGLTQADRVRYGTKYLGIVGILDRDERGVEQVLECVEVMP